MKKQSQFGRSGNGYKVNYNKEIQEIKWIGNLVKTKPNKANLRLATCTQNSYNRRQVRKNKSSKYTGVSWKERTKKWAVIICYKRKNIIVGYFKDEIQAAKAYDKAAKKYHGEFATLNFPD